MSANEASSTAPPWPPPHDASTIPAAVTTAVQIPVRLDRSLSTMISPSGTIQSEYEAIFKFKTPPLANSSSLGHPLPVERPPALDHLMQPADRLRGPRHRRRAAREAGRHGRLINPADLRDCVACRQVRMGDGLVE